MLQFLAERSEVLVNIMLSKLTKESLQFNRSICQQYDIIVNRITSPSTSTNDLVELERFIDNLRSGPLVTLKVLTYYSKLFNDNFSQLPVFDIIT